MPASTNNPNAQPSRRLINYAAAVLALLVCLYGLGSSAKAGLSSVVSTYAGLTGRLDATNSAIKLAPDDPAGHYARARLLMQAKQPAAAVAEYEQTTARRPRDYRLWLDLADARAQAGQPDGALDAFAQAVRQAPYYASPHWEYGHQLFRLGRDDEAFGELRRAAASDPALLPAAIDFAWAVTGEDAPAVEQAIKPETNEAHVALARFFARHGQTGAALAQFQAAGGPSAADRGALVNSLITAGRFADAYSTWTQTEQGRALRAHDPNALMIDGGFEQSASLKEPGFGWQITAANAVRVTQDAARPRTGGHSLRLEWNGESDPSAAVVFQLVLVEPRSRYRLSLAARTEEVVTGGVPVIYVQDAGAGGRIIAQSPPLPQGTTAWQPQEFEFATGEGTGAVRIGVQRLACNRAPCPAFGRVWLDDMTLRKL